ncbi:hypothetical protein QQ045_002098 [Rhodiola kirilowii]
MIHFGHCVVSGLTVMSMMPSPIGEQTTKACQDVSKMRMIKALMYLLMLLLDLEFVKHELFPEMAMVRRIRIVIGFSFSTCFVGSYHQTLTGFGSSGQTNLV